MNAFEIIIILRHTNTNQQNLFRLLPSLHHMGRTLHPYENHEKCVWRYSTEAGQPGWSRCMSGMWFPHDTRYRLPAFILSVKPVSLDGFDFHLCFYVKSYHSPKYNMKLWINIIYYVFEHKTNRTLDQTVYYNMI